MRGIVKSKSYLFRSTGMVKISRWCRRVRTSPIYKTELPWIEPKSGNGGESLSQAAEKYNVLTTHKNVLSTIETYPYAEKLVLVCLWKCAQLWKGHGKFLVGCLGFAGARSEMRIDPSLFYFNMVSLVCIILTAAVEERERNRWWARLDRRVKLKSNCAKKKEKKDFWLNTCA